MTRRRCPARILQPFTLSLAGEVEAHPGRGSARTRPSQGLSACGRGRGEGPARSDAGTPLPVGIARRPLIRRCAPPSPGGRRRGAEACRRLACEPIRRAGYCAARVHPTRVRAIDAVSPARRWLVSAAFRRAAP
jgi:hypothetical protein